MGYKPAPYSFMSELYIAHHGILGQKWGKRNGPPYPLSPSDHSAAEKKAQASKVAEGLLTQNIKGGKDKPNVSIAEKIPSESRKALGEVASIAQKKKRLKRTKEARKEMEQMTDEELRKRNNRLDMERRYIDLTTDEVSVGFDIADSVLSMIGSAAAVAAISYGIKKTVL